jgi:hypothetical protein
MAGPWDRWDTSPVQSRNKSQSLDVWPPSREASRQDPVEINSISKIFNKNIVIIGRVIPEKVFPLQKKQTNKIKAEYDCLEDTENLSSFL